MKRSLLLSPFLLTYLAGCPLTPAEGEGEGEGEGEACSLPSTVDSDTVIESGCDFVVDGVVTVNAKLTLQSDVAIRFGDNGGLDVSSTGALNAIGTSDKPITLTGTVQTPGSWRGVMVRSNNPANVLEHTAISFGGGERYAASNGTANLYVDTGARLGATNVTLSNSQSDGAFIETGVAIDVWQQNRSVDNDGFAVVVSAEVVGSIDAGSTYEENGDNRIKIIARAIDEAQTWPNAGVPYFLSGIVVVNDALTIAAGASFEADVDAGIDVAAEGSLAVAGTAAAPVTMVGDVNVEGTWSGVIVRSNNPANALSFLQISDAGGARFSASTGEANVYVDTGARAAIADCTFADSLSFGLFVEGGTNLSGYARNTFANNGTAAARVSAQAVRFMDEASTHDDVVQVFGAVIDAAGVWPSLDQPWLVDGVVTVNAALSVAPGARLQFATDAGIEVVDGSLAAIGTAAAHISMRGAVDVAGAWSGLSFNSNNPLNALTFVDVAHGGGARWGGTEDEANVYVQDTGRVSIANSQFTDSQDYGVYFEAEATVVAFSNNTFSDNAQAAVGISANTLGALDSASDYDDTASRGVEVRAATVTAPQTWQDFNATTVFTGVSLLNAAVTIADGADYRFDVDAGLDVRSGALTAIAAAPNGIRLVGLLPVAGQWSGVIFQSNSPSNALTNVEIRHGGGERFSGTSGQANVYVNDNARVSLTSCLLADSAAFGLFSEASATATVVGLSFANNVSGNVGPI